MKAKILLLFFSITSLAFSLNLTLVDYHDPIANHILDAEVINDMPEFKDLPPRTTKNNHLEVHKERQKLQNIAQKAKSTANRNKLRREQHKWLKRAKAVGIDPLPSRRPTAGQKKAWHDSIISAEKKASQDPQE